MSLLGGFRMGGVVWSGGRTGSPETGGGATAVIKVGVSLDG